MRNISMAYVTPAFVGDAKCVTRRKWKDSYAKGFNAGDILDVTSKQYLYGGVKIGQMELKEKPYLEDISVWKDREETLYEEEGFKFLEDELDSIDSYWLPMRCLTRIWIGSEQELYVVPFKTISIEDGAKKEFLTEVEIKKAREKCFKALTNGMYTPESIIPFNNSPRVVA